MRRSLPLLALIVSPLAASQVTVVASETFEYPVPGLFHAQTGGFGWSNAWYVDGAVHDEQVLFDNTMPPMFALSDGVGAHVGQVVPFGSAYRQLDLAAHPDLLDSATGMWGADGATIWVSFSTVAFDSQPPDHYGGLSLWKAGQAQPEALLLGSPWDAAAWGIDDEGPNGNPGETIFNTDDTIPARLVYRIDFQPGNERVRLWVSPGNPYPTVPADLDTTVVDLRFDEIRLSSGGNNNDRFFFDAIEIAKGVPLGTIGSSYCTAEVNSTGAAAEIVAVGSIVAADDDVTLIGGALPTGSFGFFLASRMQGFVANPGGSEGNLCLGGGIGRYVGPGQIQNSGASGEISLALDLTQVPQPTGFVAAMAGDTWNFQAWFRDTVGGQATSNFTDGVSLTFN